jgi:hypothetical protein
VFLENLAENQSVVTLLLAHGAGAPMDSAFLQAIAERLAQRQVNVLRFEFPYMAGRRLGRARRPPDATGVLLDCYRQAWQQARMACPGALAIGGKSMGGRMASLLADELEAAALVCLGYPFHPVGRLDKPRVAHLSGLCTPTLIVQGERDPLGSRQTVENYPLSSAVHLHWLAAADHDLCPLKRSGMTHAQHLDSAADAVAAFLGQVVAG